MSFLRILFLLTVILTQPYLRGATVYREKLKLGSTEGSVPPLTAYLDDRGSLRIIKEFPAASVLKEYGDVQQFWWLHRHRFNHNGGTRQYYPSFMFVADDELSVVYVDPGKTATEAVFREPVTLALKGRKVLSLSERADSTVVAFLSPTEDGSEQRLQIVVFEEFPEKFETEDIELQKPRPVPHCPGMSIGEPVTTPANVLLYLLKPDRRAVSGDGLWCATWHDKTLALIDLRRDLTRGHVYEEFDYNPRITLPGLKIQDQNGDDLNSQIVDVIFLKAVGGSVYDLVVVFQEALAAFRGRKGIKGFPDRFQWQHTDLRSCREGDSHAKGFRFIKGVREFETGHIGVPIARGHSNHEITVFSLDHAQKLMPLDFALLPASCLRDNKWYIYDGRADSRCHGQILHGSIDAGSKDARMAEFPIPMGKIRSMVPSQFGLFLQDDSNDLYCLLDVRPDQKLQVGRVERYKPPRVAYSGESTKGQDPMSPDPGFDEDSELFEDEADKP